MFKFTLISDEEIRQVFDENGIESSPYLLFASEITNKAQSHHTLKEVMEEGEEDCEECATEGFHHRQRECPKWWQALKAEAEK